jgi:uncharacterized membrane protein
LNPPISTPRARAHNLFLLTLILLLAAFLRFYNLSSLGFWTDEFCTLSDTNGWGLKLATLPGTGIIPPTPLYTRRSDRQPVQQIIPLLQEDVHPPIYFLLLRGWEALTNSDSEFTVRTLDVLFSLLAILLLYAAAIQFLPASTSLWACLLMAVAGSQIEFAQEARNYMPLLTFSLAAAVPLLRIQRLGRTKTRLALFFVAILSMLLTHYFALAVIAALAIYTLLQFRGKDRLATLATLILAGIVFAIAWGPHLLKQLPHFSSSHQWLHENDPHPLRHMLRLILDLPLRFLIEPNDSHIWRSLAPLVGISWLLIPLALFRPQLRLWSLWLICTVAFVAIADILDSTVQLEFIRFTLSATPAAYILIAAAIPRGRLRHLLPALAVLLSLIALPAAYTPPWKLDFRTPATTIASRLNPDDALVFIGSPADSTMLAVTYFGFRHYLPHDPKATALLQSPATTDVLTQLSTCHQIWVVQLDHTPPTNQILPGFTSAESGSLPYFLTISRGNLAPPQSTAPSHVHDGLSLSTMPP